MDNPTLLGLVKRKLNVTWEDETTTARIEDIMESAIPILVHKLGISDSSFDFSVAGAERDLYLAYCLYEWNHCKEEFDVNYANEIAQVRAIHEVKNYLADSEESGNEEEV